MLLTFLSFSLFLMQQTPRAIVVKCDGSVYDVDVDVDNACIRLLNETTYPTHLLTMHLSRNETSWLCIVREKIVTNHLQ